MRGLSSSLSLGTSLTSLGLAPVQGGGVTPITYDAIYSQAAAAFGTFKLIESYSGPCLRVIRPSDSAEMDIGFVDGRLDIATLWNFCPLLVARLKTAYDITGNGKHFTTIAGEEPYIRSDFYENGQQTISLAGDRNGTPCSLIIPTTLQLARANHSVFMAIAPHSSLNQQYYYYWGSTSSVSHGMFSDNLATGLGIGLSGNRLFSNLHPRAQPSIIGQTSRADGQAIYMQEQIITTATPQAAATFAAGGFIGKNTSGQTLWTGNFDLTMMVFFPTGLSQADAVKVRDHLSAQWKVPTAFTSRVLFDGDSLSEARRGSRSLGDYMSFVQRARRQIKGTPEIYNFGISGQTYATMLTNIANVTGLKHPTLPTVVHALGGTNDLLGGSPDPTTFYASPVSAYRDQIKTNGMKIALATIPPSGQWVTTKRTAWEGINQRIRADVIADAIADYAGNATIGTPEQAVSPYFDTDNVHMSELGDSIYAPISIAAINSMLPA